MFQLETQLKHTGPTAFRIEAFKLKVSICIKLGSHPSFVIARHLRLFLDSDLILEWPLRTDQDQGLFNNI